MLHLLTITIITTLTIIALAGTGCEVDDARGEQKRKRLGDRCCAAARKGDMSACCEPRWRDWSAAPASGRVRVLMMDSRVPTEPSSGYLYLSHTINRLWAAKFGYEFHFDDRWLRRGCARHRPACFHPVHGGRAAPWCKLLAVNESLHALPDGATLLFLDSDAFARPPFRPLPLTDAPLAMFNNCPFYWDASVNSGIQIWRNGPGARRLVQEWWDSRTETNVRHDYEQQVVHRHSDFWRRNAAHVEVLTGLTLSPRAPAEDQPFAHVIHFLAKLRAPKMLGALRELGEHAVVAKWTSERRRAREC